MGYLSLSPPAPTSQFTAAYQIGWVVAINTTALRLRQLGYPTVGGFPTPPRRFAGMFVETFEARANKEPLTHRLWPHGHGIELAMVAADAAVNECGVDVGFVDGFPASYRPPLLVLACQWVEAIVDGRVEVDGRWVDRADLDRRVQRMHPIEGSKVVAAVLELHYRGWVGDPNVFGRPS